MDLSSDVPSSPREFREPDTQGCAEDGSARAGDDPPALAQRARHSRLGRGKSRLHAWQRCLATQYAAYLAYARIQEIRGNAELARAYLKKADDVRALVNTKWWNEKEQRFIAVWVS